MALHKKFLVSKNSNLQNLKVKNCKNTIEFYTKARDCIYKKYIEENGKYFKIIKKTSTKKTQKIEINKDKFLQKQQKRISYIVEKNFYCISSNVCYIDYVDFNVSFLYFTSKKSERYLSLLKEKYQDYIEKDVTQDIKYSDFYISMFGYIIKRDLNLYKILKEIDKGVDMKDFLKENIDYRDAVRIKLYMIYINLVQDRFEILGNKSSESINNFKKNIESAITLLDEYADIFDKNVHEKVLDNLTLVHRYTSIYDTIQSLKNNMGELKSCNNKNFYKLVQKYDSNITNKVNKFLAFLETKEYSIIIKQLEILIKELSKNSKVDENITIENNLRKKLKKNFKKSLKIIEKNIECEDEESVKKIINKVNRVYLLIKNFKSLFKMDEFYKIKRKITKLLDHLNQYKYTYIFEKIVLEDMKDKGKECIEKSMQDKREKLLEEIKKDIKKYKKIFS